ncbi:MAG: hypothetical protein KAR20_19885, partial [Candidatus Heimdallarchaeota archaeon]|nr:hypothetical protein [Candidatus Heimdallarchaeota archaeon]
MIIYWLYLFAEWLAISLPVQLGYHVAYFLTGFKFFFVPKERQYIKNNLSIILGNENDKRIPSYTRQIYANFGKYLYDFFRSSKVDK